MKTGTQLGYIPYKLVIRCTRIGYILEVVFQQILFAILLSFNLQNTQM